jgi:hypothetical protein
MSQDKEAGTALEAARAAADSQVIPNGRAPGLPPFLLAEREMLDERALALRFKGRNFTVEAGNSRG